MQRVGRSRSRSWTHAECIKCVVYILLSVDVLYCDTMLQKAENFEQKRTRICLNCISSN